VTDEDEARYVSFYLLLANSMTPFNIRQYRQFPSIFMVEYEVGNWPSIWDPPDIWKLLQLKAEFKNTIKYGKVPVLGTKKYYIIRHNNLGRRHIEFRQMSIRGTANNCKTAFSL